MKPVVVFLYILVIACVCLAGCGEGSGPQGTVKAFLDEVNKGNIQGGKLYFSGQYSGGYDPYDEKKLSTLFPPGSIQDVTFTNVKVMGNRATLTVTIRRKNRSNYEAHLVMVKKEGQWKINYDGWAWPFEVK